MKLTDPKICRKAFKSLGTTGMPNQCPARKFGVYQSLNSCDPRKINQLKKFSQILNQPNFRDLIVSDLCRMSDIYLPTHSEIEDLYFEIYLSLLNFLSVSQGYFGFSALPAGVLIRNEWFEWYNLFGETIFSKHPSRKFIEDSITIGRVLMFKNIGTGDFGPITKMFFEERSLGIPSNLYELKCLELQHSNLLSEIYFEIAVRLIRGIDNMAYNICYCISRDCDNNYSYSSNNLSTIDIRKYVVESLRYNPPIGMISRVMANTKKETIENINFDAHSLVQFDIVAYNRFLFEDFNLDFGFSHKYGASFGLYTHQSCPAISFSIDICVEYLKLFWTKNKWVPKSGTKVDYQKNERLNLTGEITNIIG